MIDKQKVENKLEEIKRLFNDEKRFVIARELSHFFLYSSAFTDVSLKVRFAHIEKIIMQH